MFSSADILPMAHKRRQTRPNFTYNLGPHVKRGIRLFPRIQGQCGQAFRTIRYPRAPRFGFSLVPSLALCCACCHRRLFRFNQWGSLKNQIRSSLARRTSLAAYPSPKWQHYGYELEILSAASQARPYDSDESFALHL
jgi:hypothetical protein